MTDWSLKVLGVGRGATHVLSGEPSTSFVLCADRRPLLWIDTGLGSTRACLRHFAAWPDVWLLTHNHTDHVGELPVLLALAAKGWRRPVIVSESEVGRLLRQHRMAEHAAWQPADTLAEWLSAAPGVPLALPTQPPLQVIFRVGVHSEHSAGFVLSDANGPVLGYTGDSAFDTELYAFVLQADCALLDMREQGNDSHAGFERFESGWRDRAWIVGHGLAAPQKYRFPDLPLAFADDVISIGATRS
ncbi:MAG: MBL fold metallo-hydrolase [Gammaproteobacteria bacterium HGW-Gammaproteobacteria-7]|nr:MAG: MBL fold metallo-hydrolase [Gammaproteobacteria bacterium HGW-Gammaproteobacteria-7]